MRLPPSPPHPTQEAIQKAVVNMTRPEVQEYIAVANREYYHWNKLRYRPRPPGMTAEEGWHVVHLSRLSQHRRLPLEDENGRAFTYWLPDPATAILHEVDRGGGTFLAASMETAPILGDMRDRVVVSSLMEEAIATSQIEGAVTTRQVAKEMLRTRRKPRDRSEQMILNSYQAIQLLRQKVSEPLTLEFLFEIQQRMTQGTLDDPTAAGRFRTAEEQVTVVDARDGEVMHTPPSAGQLEARLEKMIRFANEPREVNSFIHPLVKAAILHFWLAYEHPFVDGNGRTARALYYWHMLKCGYWLFEVLTISRVILNAPAAYYESFLHSENDRNDLTYFVMHQLKTTQRALGQLREYLALKQAEHKEMAMALRQFPDLNHRQRAVLQEAIRDPSRLFTFASHQAEQNITLVTARTDLIRLETLGLLQEVKQGRQRAFLAAADLTDRLAVGKPMGKRRKR